MADEKQNGATAVQEPVPEPDPIFGDIRQTMEEIRDLQSEINVLKERVKAKTGEMDGAWERLYQLNDELVNPRPLFAKKAEAATPAAETAKAEAEPTPAEVVERSNWRTVPVSELEKHGLSPKITALLNEGGIATIGDIAKLGEKHLCLTDVRGIGESKANQIEEAQAKFWEEWGPVDETTQDGGVAVEEAPPEADAEPEQADEQPAYDDGYGDDSDDDESGYDDDSDAEAEAGD